MPGHRIFHSYDSSTVQPLSTLYLSLFQEQALAWPRFQEGAAALKNVAARIVHCDGYDVQLQFNPKRIQSTSAKVDSKSIQERRCFLCTENLPIEQRGILYKNEFLLLTNPAPIFEHHGTIAHTQHIPQAIEDRFDIFLDLVKDLAPLFTLFYNGPHCGASAPDHLHVQASPSGKIPAELESLDPRRIDHLLTRDSVNLFTMKNYGRAVLVLEFSDAPAGCALVHRIISVTRNILAIRDEPPLNILFSYTSGRWRIIVIPRKKHRPDVYYKEGEDRILISPASVDMGGLVITPLEKDFLRVDAALIQHIFNEVSFDPDMIDRILDQL